MRRKLFFAWFVCTASIFIVACKKDTPSLPPPTNSIMSMLTANVWIYDTVYKNWGQPGQSFLYVRGDQNSTQDWSKSRLKFYIDGTFNEILTSGLLRQGVDTWTMSNDSTLLFTTGGGYSNVAQIVSLKSTKLVWADSINKVRGVQIPKY